MPGNRRKTTMSLQNESMNSGEVRKKYCRFKKAGIKYIDYKDPNFLLKLLNDQGRILPRRLTGTSLKFQRKVAVAVKRARHLALLPFVADSMK
jgi:small subunit ribosomal protein S18